MDRFSAPTEAVTDQTAANEAPKELSKMELRALKLQRRKKKKALLDKAQMISEIYGEQPFEPGVDSGLKTWIFVREQMRATQAGMTVLPVSYPTRSAYKYGTYWQPEIKHTLDTYMRIDKKEEETISNVEGEEKVEDTGGTEGEEKKVVKQKEFDINQRFEPLDENGLTREERQWVEREHMFPPIPASEARRFPAWSIEKFKNQMLYGNIRDTLMVAYYTHHWRYMDMLLSQKGKWLLDMHITDTTHHTILHRAVQEGDIERVEYLLQHGASVHHTDILGNGVLHMCLDHEPWIQFRPLTVMRMLVKNGAKVNACNKRGITPLHRAIILNAQEHITFLLQNKANVYLFDQYNRLPFDYCKEENRDEIKELFDANVRFCGKKKHVRMWAHGMSQDFVKSIFDIVAPRCPTCKRKRYDCEALKQKNYRYWRYAHELSTKTKK